jgi:hypothetical protein
MPAVVTAKASTQPRTGTLRIVPQADGGISAAIVRGSGQTLDDLSTLADTRRTLTSGQRQVAQLAGNLSSRSGYDASAELKRLGIDFVLLTPPASTLDRSDTSAADATRMRAAVAMDANPLLAQVGATSTGRLWAFDRGTGEIAAAAQIPAGAGGLWRVIVLVVQGIVIGITALLAIPTSRSADRVSELSARRPGRRRDEEAAVEPDDEPPAPDEASEGVAGESVSEYEAEPADEALVESAEEDEIPAREPAPPAVDAQRAVEAEAAAEAEPTAERVTTPPAPTTLEEGLEETIVRPRRSFEGGDHG